MSEGKCPDIDKYLIILRQMLDNEATSDQEQFLLNHIDGCKCCLAEYELEQQVREVLKSKLEKKEVPVGLANSIKAKILRTAKNVR